jgi:hypothetical protein
MQNLTASVLMIISSPGWDVLLQLSYSTERAPCNYLYVSLGNGAALGMLV